MAIDFSNALGIQHNEQQDPNEFARLLFDRMEESFSTFDEPDGWLTCIIIHRIPTSMGQRIIRISIRAASGRVYFYLSRIWYHPNPKCKWFLCHRRHCWQQKHHRIVSLLLLRFSWIPPRIRFRLSPLLERSAKNSKSSDTARRIGRFGGS